MDHDKPLLIKRYASRRLYNTETSDYVTLEDLARVIQSGRDLSVIDLKTGDDVTRQYLLQIIAEHEAKGKNVLPLGLLTDLIRSYSSEAEAVIPQFLAATFQPEAQPANPQGWQGRPTKDLAEIRQQLADLQDRLARL
ncbi:polyhydroxyalkanoate synthesis repressor PhaR [Falsirhodobacter sp. 20TX0035]|uniref:polyhydroxyalkanoate synthesis repressor PhaR n=1 Tax=Falsirhodobacter sp. 20TX0035 TaxID=3022019 RepID=UPI00232E4FF5|nr:polyhydroxyalkanoate synthesis repressor PhaR [Falsirhodobacter sp. 20TX0035]MDB6452152.1 polyhydroxyalkanoate synthesis repressor PhaR [Falsirhodobacter sp. 20TX0035]